MYPGRFVYILSTWSLIVWPHRILCPRNRACTLPDTVRRVDVKHSLKRYRPVTGNRWLNIDKRITLGYVCVLLWCTAMSGAWPHPLCTNPIAVLWLETPPSSFIYHQKTLSWPNLQFQAVLFMLFRFLPYMYTYNVVSDKRNASDAQKEAREHTIRWLCFVSIHWLCFMRLQTMLLTVGVCFSTVTATGTQRRSWLDRQESRRPVLRTFTSTRCTTTSRTRCSSLKTAVVQMICVATMR